MNKVILIGRLTRDPELRRTQSGMGVTSFGLAVDKYSKETGRSADFFDIVCWDKRADFAVKYLRKGSKIALSGRLQQRQWTDKEGGKRNSVEIVADEVEFADSKGGDGGGGDSYERPAPSYQQPQIVQSPPPSLDAPSSFHELTDDDGDLPF
ncbi:single-stranded DNA-binding protein [Clostridia bacterium]|nr:single-stranded DNA-binding protein [Clostridia bacterium]